MGKSLEELGVDTKCAFMPKSNVTCLMKSGAKIETATPLTTEDLIILWGSKKRTIKIPADGNSYIVINKRHVDYAKFNAITNNR